MLLKNIKRQDGFTLTELALVMIILGLTTSSIMIGVNVYIRDQSRERTQASLEQATSALVDMQVIDGYYPCPADPTLPPTHPNYGQEDCNAGGGIVVVTGRDADNADNDNDETTGGDPVMIGAIPFNYMRDRLIDPDRDTNLSDSVLRSTLGSDEFTASDTIDGWNAKITYAVSVNLSNAVNPAADTPPAAGTERDFTHEHGAISVIDEVLNDVTDRPGIAHFALISHGPNNLGAFTENGTYIGDCVDITTPVDATNYQARTRADERENCDHENGGIADATFLIGSRNDTENNYNDDIVKFAVSNVSTLWEYTGGEFFDNGTPGDPTDDFIINKLANTNEGNIGIGTEDPQEKVHLEGDVQAFEIHAEGLCDSTGQFCMPPEAIGGELPEMQCPSGEIITRIENNKVTCEDPFQGAYAPCPPGKFMIGLSSANGPICGDPP